MSKIETHHLIIPELTPKIILVDKFQILFNPLNKLSFIIEKDEIVINDDGLLIKYLYLYNKEYIFEFIDLKLNKERHEILEQINCFKINATFINYKKLNYDKDFINTILLGGI